MIDIVRWAESKLGFYVDRAYTGGAWQLGAAPIRLAGYHAAILRHVFTPDASGRLPYDVIAWCEPAKSGKSAIAGLAAQYMGLHGERNSRVILASNKREQAASLMYGSFAYSIEHNPALGLEPGTYSTRLDNGNEVLAIPSNSRGEAGARFSLVVFDELWGYVHTDAERLWTEFKTDPIRQNSLRMAIGYAGYLESALWLEQLQAGQGEPVPELAHIVNPDGAPACWASGRHFTFWSRVCRQPWQTAEWRAGLRASLRPAEYRRMVACEFVEGEGDFVDADAWAALIDPSHRPLEPGARVPVYVGLDLALAAGGDDCALVGVYPDDGRVKLAFHRVWTGKRRKARLKLGETVKPFILGASRDYRLAGVWFDPWQAQRLADELRAEGIRCFEVPQTHASRGPKDTRLYEAVVNRELVLYDDPDVRKAAAGANAKELGNGLIFLKKAGRAKIDLLIALSNCAADALDPRPAPAGASVDMPASVFKAERRSLWAERDYRKTGRRNVLVG